MCEQPQSPAANSGQSATPNDGQRAAEGIRIFLAGEADLFTLEYPCHSSMQERWFELSARPLPGESGPTGAVLMHLDITTRKRTSLRLARLSLETERRERIFSTLLSSIPDLAYVFDRQARVVYANEPTVRLWGVSLEAAQGKTLVEIGYAADLAQLESQILWVLNNGKPLKHETPFVDGEGRLAGTNTSSLQPLRLTAASNSLWDPAGTSPRVAAQKKRLRPARRSSAHLRPPCPRSFGSERPLGT